MSAWLLAAALTAVQTSPYAEQEARPIKALSQDEVRALTGGEGMGLAKAAELNSYPGPKHVLDLATELDLTAEQRALVQAAFDRMHAVAVELGAQIVARETALDIAFQKGSIDPSGLGKAVAEIARLQGELRAAHLAAHLETRNALSAAQVARYVDSRGYGDGQHDPARHQPH
jgi:hypothetical protein